MTEELDKHESGSNIMSLSSRKQEKFPIDKERVEKMRPKIEISHENNSFALFWHIPGFRKENICVYGSSNRIAIKANDKAEGEDMKVCKIYNATYTLPHRVAVEKLRKSYENGTLKVYGIFADDISMESNMNTKFNQKNLKEEMEK